MGRRGRDQAASPEETLVDPACYIAARGGTAGADGWRRETPREIQTVHALAGIAGTRQGAASAVKAGCWFSTRKSWAGAGGSAAAGRSAVRRAGGVMPCCRSKAFRRVAVVVFMVDWALHPLPCRHRLGQKKAPPVLRHRRGKFVTNQIPRGVRRSETTETTTEMNPRIETSEAAAARVMIAWRKRTNSGRTVKRPSGRSNKYQVPSAKNNGRSLRSLQLQYPAQPSAQRGLSWHLLPGPCYFPAGGTCRVCTSHATTRSL